MAHNCGTLQFGKDWLGPNMLTRKLRNLTVEDLKDCPVWEMVEDDKGGDVLVKALKRLPVRTLHNRLVGTQLNLADGSSVWALLGNMSTVDPTSTQHFMTVSVHRDGDWFDLARYHDVDYSRRDGLALAKFLAKRVQDVFPLRYDVTSVVSGAKQALSGQVPSSPHERLNPDELIRLSLQDE
jgi:hypothetical protein